MAEKEQATGPEGIWPQHLDLDSLARYYHSRLTAEARDYLYQRGLSDRMIDAFTIGFDDGARFGFIDKVGGLGDYFRERYIFPIKDAAGKVVNMVGRSTGNDQPLYKDLPANLVVDPDALFNEGAIAGSETVLLCEGIIDALSLIQAGFPGVAMLGTNSIKEKLAEKFTGKHVFLCFDNDAVGQMARDAVARVISEKAAEVYFINLPEGSKDVNEFFIRTKDAPHAFTLLVYQAVESGKYRQFPADTRNLNAFMQEFSRRSTGKRIGVPTGFPRLDGILFGGLLAGLYLITGKPGVGKTTFLKNMADSIAAQRIPIIFVSLEMSSFELWAKSISRLTGFSAADILTGKADVAAVQAANQKYGELAGYIWTVEGREPVTVSDIDAYIYQTVNELGTVPVVCVDYLQRMTAEIPAQVYSQEISDSFNALALKRLAQKYGCPVLVASASGESRADTGHPAGAAAYTADVVMQLVPSSGAESADGAEVPRPVSLHIAKNRNGVGGSIPLRFDPARNRYESDEQN